MHLITPVPWTLSYHVINTPQVTGKPCPGLSNSDFLFTVGKLERLMRPAALPFANVWPTQELRYFSGFMMVGKNWVAKRDVKTSARGGFFRVNSPGTRRPVQIVTNLQIYS
ncbi:MAG TPA: hypothetical protein VLT16_10565 [Candidatus Limnocylindrales bacterium]|nr:hypothetical protein [Candidatus Limnocylindrales bacterium]